jgi:8-oxo-dGTP pyrophosphatase MutT (NUDIX family)
LDLKAIAEMPASLAGQPKGSARTQYGALCYRIVKGKPQILLITSRTRRRWIIPKGWPIDTLSPAETAATEAWEEAGIRGKVKDMCLGVYGYMKIGEAGEDDLPCVVAVYPIKAKSMATKYPESKERRRKWFSPKKAARKVAEPELRRILQDFDPAKLG